MPSKQQSTPLTYLYRSETNRVIAGVAGGLGEYFEIDPTIIRIIFILLTVFGGSGILIYLVLWLIIPNKNNLGDTPREHLKNNAQEFRQQAEKFAQDIKINRSKHDGNFWLGALIVLMGVIFLLGNFSYFDTGKLWPLFLVILGVAILTKR